MAEQETLTGEIADRRTRAVNPEDYHLFSRVLTADRLFIDVAAWNRARAEQSYVGQCRACCGGYLLALPSDVYASGPEDVCAQWLGMECQACGHEFVAPDAKVLARSARHSRMPRQFMRNRAGVLADPRSQGG
jgi:hypothetical protein